MTAHRLIVGACLAAGFTTLLDQSVLNVAMPALRGSLHAGDAALQWIMAGYSLTFGLALVPAGRLGDMYGRRALFAGGLTVFAVCGIVAALASDAWAVAAARLVQGAGAGVVNPQIIGLFQDLFTGTGRARALGAYAVVGGVAASVGPPVGGVILHLAGDDPGWRLVLLLNLPFAIATVPLALKLLPKDVPDRRRTQLDLPGLLLLAAATLAVLLPLVGVSGGWWWAAAAAAGVAALVAWERRYTARGRTALLLPALTRSRGFVLGTLVAMCYFGAALALNLVIALFLQDGLGLSPLAAAALSLPGAVGFAASSTASHRLVSRYGRHGVSAALAVAAVSVAAAAAATMLLPVGGVVVALGVSQLVTGAAGGLINAPNQALTLTHAPPGAGGLSAAMLQLSQRLAASVSIAAVTGIFLHTAQAGLLQSYRAALTHGTLLCLALVLLSLLFAVADGVAVRAVSVQAVADGPTIRRSTV
ncbi:MFS transporter [Dactylosporangium sp. AC04546]|uniref:MFS transporter n=1 Tax=Dactylosporangium sp. AC04546 TaxID=2862460 RepID=UPI001EE15263|nr:MFS transporter [Dactylosporangium sp. AC04546]WVK89196.1 MFS transporter [Dactylosporangium sp. AC04546]